MMEQLQLLWNLQMNELKRTTVMQKKQSLSSEALKMKWQEITTITASIAKQKANLDLNNEEVKKLEDSLAELYSNLKTAEDKLYNSGIRNIKEINQLRSKYDAMKTNVALCEDKLLVSMEVCYGIEQSIESMTTELIKIRQQHEEERRSISRAIADVDTSLADIENELSNITASIDKDLLKTYYDLKQAMNNPVAKLKNEFCSGCHRSLPMVKVKAAKNGIIFCENCGRLLFSENE